MKTALVSLSFAILSLFAVGCKNADVTPKPVADFTYSVISVSNVQKQIVFTNTSKNADRFQWLTPSGLANTDRNLSISVTENSRVNVSLTAKSDAGEDTKTQSIDITDLATTGTFIFWSQIGNEGDISIYINNNLQGKLTQYITNGVAPACGQQGFVTVTYSPGTYSFTAQGQGLFPKKWSGNFTVVRGACNSTQLTR